MIWSASHFSCWVISSLKESVTPTASNFLDRASVRSSASWLTPRTCGLAEQLLSRGRGRQTSSFQVAGSPRPSTRWSGRRSARRTSRGARRRVVGVDLEAQPVVDIGVQQLVARDRPRPRRTTRWPATRWTGPSGRRRPGRPSPASTPVRPTPRHETGASGASRVAGPDT